MQWECSGDAVGVQWGWRGDGALRGLGTRRVGMNVYAGLPHCRPVQLLTLCNPIPNPHLDPNSGPKGAGATSVSGGRAVPQVGVVYIRPPPLSTPHAHGVCILRSIES